MARQSGNNKPRWDNQGRKPAPKVARRGDVSSPVREELYARAEELGQFGHWNLDLDQGKTVWSRQLYRILGLNPAKDKPGLARFLERVHPSDRELVAIAVKKVLASTGITEHEFRILRPDGQERFIHAVVEVVAGENGQPKVAFGTLHDFTERRRMEAALQESEEKWRSMMENSPDNILLVDEQGIIRYINRTVYREYEEIVGTSILDFTPEEARHRLEALLQEVWKTGKPLAGEFQHLIPGNIPRLFDIRVTPLYRAGRVTALLVRSTDITERRRLQDEVGKIKQMEALGLLAGGIAHDLNNILTVILTNLSIARTYGKLEDDILQAVREAEVAALRGNGLTQQLVAFSMGAPPVRKPTTLAGLIRDTTEFCLSGSKVRCEYSLPPDLWMVNADQSQLAQVIQNLVINANQAMEGGGVLRILAENVILREGEYAQLRAGRHVKITFEDHGPGIPAEVLPRIFDPFFSTKEQGRGLGLAITFSIIHRHEGHIQVESRPGAGTVFHVFLPAGDHGSETL